MHPDEGRVVRPPLDADPERLVRVLDGGRFTFAAQADVRAPRFLESSASSAPAAARRRRP